MEINDYGRFDPSYHAPQGGKLYGEAAPIVLAALEDIAAHDPETCGGITPQDCLDAVREIARAAIAKAMG